MIARLSAGIVALLVFVGMLFSGYVAGNTFSTIVLRALLGMAGGLAVGYTAGTLGRMIVHEHFRATVLADVGDAESERPAEDGVEDAKPEENTAIVESDTGEDKEVSENSRDKASIASSDTPAARAARKVLDEA